MSVQGDEHTWLQKIADQISNDIDSDESHDEPVGH